jgi:hypothetical protein
MSVRGHAKLQWAELSVLQEHLGPWPMHQQHPPGEYKCSLQPKAACALFFCASTYA